MAKELPNGLDDFLQSRAGANFASWAIITLPLLQGSPSSAADGRIYHLATSKITIDGITYDDQLQRVGELRRSIDRAAKKVSIAIQNITGEFGTTLLGDIDVLHGATVTPGRWWQDQITGAQWTDQTFTGVVDGASGDEQVITLECLSDLYAVRSVGGGRVADRLCPLVFNAPGIRASGSGIGDACGYAGGDTTCERTVAACTEKGNLHRYGGFVQIEANTASAVAAIKPATNYQLVKDADGETVAMASAVKVANAAVATTGNVTTIKTAASGVFYVEAAPYNGDLAAAVAAAEAAGEGIVYCDAKAYTVTGLSWTGRVFIQGAGEGRTIIYSTTNAPIISISADAAFRGGGVLNCTVRGSVTAGGSQIGIKLDDSNYVYRCLIRDVRIEDCGDHGLYIGKAFSSRFENIFITNCADYPLLYNGVNQPGNVFHSVYVGDLRSGAAVAFRIKRGEFIGYNLNGVNNVISGSEWMRVGRKNGVDGDSTDDLARVQLYDCNLESWDGYGIKLYHASTVELWGRTNFAGNGTSGQIGIYFDLAGNGSSFYSQFIERGIIADTVDFADGAAAYANSQPIHANGFPPLQTLGQGPKTGGGVQLSTYRNTATSNTHKLARADGKASIQTVTATTTITEPGVRLIEVNNTSGGAIDVTIPWGGYYQSAQELVIIKDVGGNAATYPITVKGGGGYGTITTLNQNGQAVIVTPDGNTGSGAWRVISSWPTNVSTYAEKAGTPVEAYYTAWTADGKLTTQAGMYRIGSDTVMLGHVLFNTDGAKEIGFSGDNRPDKVHVKTHITVNGNKVVEARKTGWTAASGTAARSTFDTATVTTEQLAQRVKALIDDLISHGLIGS